MSEITNAVQNGLLSSIPVAVNNTHTFYGVSSLEQCEDVLCSMQWYKCDDLSYQWSKHLKALV